MTPQQALEVFKTQEQIAVIACVTQQAVSTWVRRGKIPPYAQRILAAFSDGKLTEDAAPPRGAELA
jgi:hypothetical protein